MTELSSTHTSTQMNQSHCWRHDTLQYCYIWLMAWHWGDRISFGYFWQVPSWDQILWLGNDNEIMCIKENHHHSKLDQSFRNLKGMATSNVQYYKMQDTCPLFCSISHIANGSFDTETKVTSWSFNAHTMTGKLQWRGLKIPLAVECKRQDSPITLIHLWASFRSISCLKWHYWYKRISGITLTSQA